MYRFGVFFGVGVFFFFSPSSFLPCLTHNFLAEKVHFSFSLIILDLSLMNGASDCPADCKPLWVWSYTSFPVSWNKQGHSLSPREVRRLNHTIWNLYLSEVFRPQQYTTANSHRGLKRPTNCGKFPTKSCKLQQNSWEKRQEMIFPAWGELL